MARLVRPALFWLGWCCALWPLWLVFVGARDLTDAVAGVVAVAVAATAALVVHELGLLSFRPRVQRFAGLGRVPLQVFADFGILVAALVRTLAGRPVRGVFLAKELPAGGRGSEGGLCAGLWRPSRRPTVRTPTSSTSTSTATRRCCTISSVFSGAAAGHAGAVRGLLVGVGLLTALVGGAMSLLQADLKRLLAFVTISHGGIFLVGIGLLEARGLAGASLSVIAGGALKGAFFLARWP